VLELLRHTFSKPFEHRDEEIQNLTIIYGSQNMSFQLFTNVFPQLLVLKKNLTIPGRLKSRVLYMILEMYQEIIKAAVEILGDESLVQEPLDVLSVVL
jgi:hypothetical protein